MATAPGSGVGRDPITAASFELLLGCSGGSLTMIPDPLEILGTRVGAALAGRTLAVAESFSGGLIVQALVAAEGSGEPNGPGRRH